MPLRSAPIPPARPGQPAAQQLLGGSPPGDDWTGRRVTVMGLGRHGGGVSAARYLAERGARVTISDAAPEERLAESLAQLSGSPIASVKLGGHDEDDFRTAEWVVVNPAVRADHACLQVARAAGAMLSSEIEIFLQRCPAQVIGVTGSNGKTTTSTMLAQILIADGRRVWLGGNIGRSLLADLHRMSARDWVVLELSSFQLAHLGSAARWPRFAVVTNCTPNHLDWHGDFAGYVLAKRRLIEHLPPDGVAVLNHACPQVGAWRSLVPCHVQDPWPWQRLGPLGVRGDHNRQNAALAAAAAWAVGAKEPAISRALAEFRGLAHRLEFLGTIAGRHVWNDSKSTTPAATLAALAAIEGDVWLLAGGHGKGAQFDELARAIIRRARGAALFGAAREQLRECLIAQRAEFNSLATEHLADALAWCWRQSRAGDAILLSPGCASYDQFFDFAARGETFRRLARTFT